VQYCTLDQTGTYRPFDSFEDQAFPQVGYLRTPSSSFSAYSAGSYQLRSEVAAFFEVSYLHRAGDHQAAREPFSTLSSGIAISKASLYNQTGGDVRGYDRTLEDFGPLRSQQRIGTLRAVAGLQGTIPDDAPALQGGAWEISWGYGRSSGVTASTALSVSRLASALGPSFVNADGVPSCGTPTAPIAGCVPVNLLGPPGSIDPDARDHVLFSARSTGFTEQQTVLATTHGRIAKLPHGDLSVAAGADFRKEAAGLTPPGDSLGELPAPAGAGYHVFEGFGELSLVPLRGPQLAERVELDLAVRGFHADAFGNGITWSAAGLVRPITSFAVRATYAAAFRAPSPGELFQVSNLAPETARVLTAGFVFEPSRIQGLSLTADYWNIDLTNAIHPISASVILSNCYTAGLEAYCNLIHRDPTGGTRIDFIDDPLSDLGDTSTSGLDIAAAYDHTLGGAGRLHEQLEAQVLFAYDLQGGQTTHSRGTYDFGVGPTIKASWSSAWQHPSGVSGGLNLRYVGSFTPCGPIGCSPDLEPIEAAAWYKVDLFGSYLFKSAAGSTTLAAGVNNLLDRNPSLLYLDHRAVPVPGGATREVDISDAATYDYVGRLFYVRLSQRF
jgi:iron complex outermembrane recepter protein